MSFGKSNTPNRRHRPKKVVEIDEDEVREKKEAKMNAPIITTVVSVVGSIAMLAIVVMAAPYTYGSQAIHYSNGNLKETEKLLETDKNLREEYDPKLLIDFTTVIMSPDMAQSEAMKKVAATCRQGRAARLVEVTPEKVHGAFAKATKFITCAMATERARLCLADERKVLVDQLMEYKERRQNVLAFDKYRDKEVAKWEEFREFKRENNQEVPGPLKITSAKFDETSDEKVSRQLEALVRNGYLSAADFGYYGLYVPSEYADALRVGADRYAPCAVKT